MHYSEIKDWPWDTFEAKEIACHSDGSIVIDADALTMLNTLFKNFGKCEILSGYRSPKHNANVGGAARSQHLYGKAFDLRIEKARQLELEEAARAAGFLGFGHYKSWLHVDTGPKREWWTGIKEEDLA